MRQAERRRSMALTLLDAYQWTTEDELDLDRGAKEAFEDGLRMLVLPDPITEWHEEVLMKRLLECGWNLAPPAVLPTPKAKADVK